MFFLFFLRKNIYIYIVIMFGLAIFGGLEKGCFSADPPDVGAGGRLCFLFWDQV